MSTTVQEASDRFVNYHQSRLEQGEIAESTFNSLRSYANKVVDWAGESTPVSSVDTDQLESDLSSEYAESTVKEAARIARRIKELPTPQKLQERLENIQSELQDALTDLNRMNAGA